MNELMQVASTMVDTSGFTKDIPLMDAGVDSLSAVSLRNELSKRLSMQLPATLVLDYPTLAAISDYL
jgi:acyl carrier protein